MRKGYRLAIAATVFSVGCARDGVSFAQAADVFKENNVLALHDSSCRHWRQQLLSPTSSSGLASWYGGEGGMTAAHRSLPFGSRVRVTNLITGQSVVVRINDRGPYIGGRIIDLSTAAARALGLIQSGLAPVHLDVLSY